MRDDKIKSYIMEFFGLNSEENMKTTALSEGMSEAEVYILEISNARRRRNIGTYVLKIMDASEENCINENEAEKSRNLYETATQYKEHLVKVRSEKIIENKLVMILSFALKEKYNSHSLAQIKLNEKFKFLENISYDLLKKMNSDRIEETNDCKMIQSLEKNKLKPEGNFVCRMKQYLDDIESPAVNIKGNILPNPYYYLMRSSNLNDILEKKNVHFIKGLIHGDLHQKNIMISRDHKDYVIIDYDRIENNFLLFDQAYLELNSYILLSNSDEWDSEKWMEALKYMYMVNDADDKNIEFADVIQIGWSICKGIYQWYEEEMPECMDDFKLQFQLARIAAGINYFSKTGITEERLHLRYLAYICYGLKELFGLIGYKWENTKATWLTDTETQKINTDILWNECGKLRNEYIKILVTDDCYVQQKYRELSAVGEIDWRMIVDIGKKEILNDLVNEMVPIIKKFNGINFMTEDKNDFNPTGQNTSIVRIKKGKNVTDFEHWKNFKKNFVQAFKEVCAKEPLKPVMMIIDIKESRLIRERFVETMLEDDLLQKGSRLICLRNKHELPLEEMELKEKKIKYYQHENLNLMDIARMLRDYGLHRKNIQAEIYLPSIESLDGCIAEEVYNNYKDVVEIVYPEMEKRLTNYTRGEEFFKGNEISWEDLEQKNDIEWEKYEQWKRILLKKLQTERVAECRLIHGAGAGGTTLSKRLMWDIKGLYPTLRVKRYTSNTANAIIDIYRKTGRCVLVVLEMGSTIISEDEYEILKRKVNAQTCHALFLKVERSTSTEESAEIYLSEDLKAKDAIKFYNSYSSMTNDSDRQKYLASITYDYTKDEWRGQCCPFFYGFYTFQEEYRGLGRFLSASIEMCTDEVKTLLADMALMTVYSQNICMSYEEMKIRLDLQNANIMELYEYLNEGIGKILSQKEIGFRICHPLIARKLLELLYAQYNSYSTKLYHAIIKFIENMNDIYGEIGREYLDKIFKEMFIDRSYIDGEHQKFALLINDLEKQTDKIEVFEKLIELYDDNPHYYNHLGRLEIYDDQNLQFDRAIKNLNKALAIARDNGYNRVPHLTTLGCIYSRKVTSELIGCEKSIKQLLDAILVDFGNANDCFLEARKLKENSTYAYFPNILMICNVAKKIARTSGKNLTNMLKDSMFERWYNCYSGMAIQLFEQMIRNCGEELSDELKSKAEREILYLGQEVEVMKAKLITQKKKNIDVRESSNLGRTVTMLLYMQNEFRWEGMKEEELEFAEKELEDILQSGEFNQYDLIAWFNIYRQMEQFETSKAKRYILDYMKDGYYKSYLLWILSFLEYERGDIAYRQVEEYMKACKYSTQLTENSIRTSRNVDAYTTATRGFPIKKFSSVQNENSFKIFKGTIVDIDGTVKGKIQMDELDDINITFVPSFTVDEQKREFGIEDIGAHVEFELVFTYSGYKAWNTKKVL